MQCVPQPSQISLGTCGWEQCPSQPSPWVRTARPCAFLPGRPGRWSALSVVWTARSASYLQNSAETALLPALLVHGGGRGRSEALELCSKSLRASRGKVKMEDRVLRAEFEP